MQTIKGVIPKSIRRRPWLMAYICIAAAFLIFRVATVRAAVDYTTMRDALYQFMEGFNKTNFTHMKDAYTNVMRFARGANAYGPGGRGGGLALFLSAVGGLIVVLGSAANVVRELRKGDVSIDFMYRVFVTTAITLLITSNVYGLMDALHGAGDLVVSTTAHYMGENNGSNELGLVGDGTGVEANQNTLIDALSSTVPGLNGDENGENTLRDLMDAGEGDVNYWAMQQAYETLDAMKYIAYAPMLVCVFLMAIAVFELRIRQLFAPIAVAWISFEGSRANGTRFLKKYVACMIKIAIYFAIAAIGSEMTKFFFTQLGTSSGGAGDASQAINLVLMLASNAFAAMAMMQSAGLGDEIVGA